MFLFLHVIYFVSRMQRRVVYKNDNYIYKNTERNYSVENFTILNYICPGNIFTECFL